MSVVAALVSDCVSVEFTAGHFIYNFRRLLEQVRRIFCILPKFIHHGTATLFHVFGIEMRQRIRVKQEAHSEQQMIARRFVNAVDAPADVFLLKSIGGSSKTFRVYAGTIKSIPG
jgi:hypothetical protein